MAVFIDFGRGWQFIPNPVTLTLLTRTDGVYDDGVVVDNCKENVQDKRDAAQSPATMDATHKVFHLWVEMLQGAVPDKGSKVVEEDGTAWHVESFELMGHRTRYRCSCRKDRTP